jgi:hypothetical protein
MRSLIHVTPRRKRPARAAYRPVVAVFEPVIVEDEPEWRVEWCPVGPNGEVRRGLVAIDKEGNMTRVTPQMWPRIASGSSWRCEWRPVGPNGEVRFVAIDEEGNMHSVTPQPRQPSAKG